MEIIGQSNLNTADVECGSARRAGPGHLRRIRRRRRVAHSSFESQSCPISSAQAMCLTTSAVCRFRAERDANVTVGDADPVVRCADERIAADSQLAYLILRDGDHHRAAASWHVTEGQTSLTLSAPERRGSRCVSVPANRAIRQRLTAHPGGGALTARPLCLS